ncbi:MAG: ferrous iron transporter B [Acidobacteria bacterium]|nr:ferrous iron transporter B [Acidobacteriota bacterium]
MSTVTLHKIEKLPKPALKPARLLLVGNPNVGKSVIFGYLTGKYVTVSNYPGTTVEVSRGKMKYGGQEWEVIDTPGINSLAPQSDDERVTRDMLLDADPDVIVQVADAKNLRRTLLITSQLAELKIPMVLVLNMMDEARHRGIEIDAKGIGELFGIPVVPAVAVEGEGLYSIFKSIVHAKVPNDPLETQRNRILGNANFLQAFTPKPNKKLPLQLTVEWLQTQDLGFRQGVESWLNRVADGHVPNDAATRTQIKNSAARLEEMRNAFLERAVGQYKTALPSVFRESNGVGLKIGFVCLAAGLLLFAYTEVGRLFGLPTPFGWMNSWMDKSVVPTTLSFLGNNHLGWLGSLFFGKLADDGSAYETGLLYPAITQFLMLIAPVIAPLAFVLRRSERFAERLGHWTRDWRTGAPMMIVILLLMYEFVGVIGAGTLVDALENNIFNSLLTPNLQRLIPSGIFYDFFVGQYGLISVGLTYALAIVLPIVMTFFIAFGLLEDSGYLPRLAILSDRLFRVMGLNGKAVLPMVLGLGCDTMATMTTRILETKKERLIATVLLALGVPCSAQLGVILAISGSLSAGAMLTVFGVVVSQMFLVGYLSSKIVKGKRGDFIFEIPPIRMPVFKNVWTKTRYRMKWYLKEALPLFVLGTLILFVLDRLRVPTPWGKLSGLDMINNSLAPLVTGVLQLPRQTSQVLVLGFLRRDYGAAGLYDMVGKGLMTPVQIVVSLIVLTLFIPCVANFFMIIREQGTKKALIILAFITPFAIAVGGIVNLVLRALNIGF